MPEQRVFTTGDPVRLISVRMPPELHARLSIYAQRSDQSVNSAVNQLVSDALDECANGGLYEVANGK